MIPKTFTILDPPSGPPLNLHPGWPLQRRIDLTAFMERHHREPWKVGDGVWIDAKRYVVSEVLPNGSVNLARVRVDHEPEPDGAILPGNPLP